MSALTAVAENLNRTADPHPCSCGGIDRLLDIPSVAAVLGVGLSSAYELIAGGALVAYKVPGAGKQRTRRRVRTSDLRAYIDGLERVQPTG